jgi:anaerobic magnesium-protoporphyrin IX monomethyl ester cyclase
MKNVVILNSPIFENAIDEQEEYLAPLGLGYIATYLEYNGFKVELIDCVKERIGVDDIINLIVHKDPDYVGINVFTQNYHLVKKILEGIEIRCEYFIGGPVIKSIYEDILLWNINNNLSIVIGEGELILPDILNGQCKESPIMEIKNKKVYRVDNNSDYLPRDISSIHLNRKYFNKNIITNHYGDNEASIITSRGCAFDCAFCGGARSLNNNVEIRIRTEQSVIEEINELLGVYPNIKCIRILDDLFLRNSKSIDMASRIFSHFPSLNWRGMVHAVSLINSLSKVEILKQSNCKELFMGIESGSPKIRKKINKIGSLNDIICVATEILRNGIDLKGYFIYGFPEETLEDFESTFELAYKIMEISRNTLGVFRTSVFKFRPYHGTALYNEIVAKKGEVPSCIQDEISNAIIERSQFNFSSGNYSEVNDEVLNNFIVKTQKLME